jgi:hypothetical protein
MVLFPNMSPHGDIPDTNDAKNGGTMWPQYGADALATPIPRDPATAAARCCAAAERGKKLPLRRPSTGLILAREPLTMTAADDYIDPLGRAAAWRDGASAKPLTVYAVNHPAMSYGYVGCAGFGGFPACRGRGRKASGCLKSESEERETWTAESLRAASSNGDGLA